jgi:hypothetical protein
VALDGIPAVDLAACLRGMPEPRLGPEDRALVERVLAAGFVAIPGASLAVHQVLARRGVERALGRSRTRGGVRR